MIEKQRSDFLDYVRFIADRFRLADWDFSLMDEDPDETSVIAIFTLRFMNSSKFCLSLGFFDLSPEEQRVSVIHELIHVHESETNFIAAERLKSVHHAYYNNAMERSTEAIARDIAPHFPLPLIGVVRDEEHDADRKEIGPLQEPRSTG